MGDSISLSWEAERVQARRDRQSNRKHGIEPEMFHSRRTCVPHDTILTSMPFREVIGHRRLLSLLSQAITRDTFTPSLIFSGPEGVGKRLTACAVAAGR